MAYLPCKNPSCSSNGQPHPNCRCYGDMAEGGEVVRFCDHGKPHQEGCEYFAEGGEAKGPTWEDTTEVEQAKPSENSAAPTWEDTEEVGEEPTWEDTEGQHETLSQQALTALEGAAQGFGGPLATAAELGLSKASKAAGYDLGISPEEIAARQEANPGTYALGQAAGLGTGLVTGTGIGGLATNVGAKLGANLSSKLGAAALSGLISNGVIQGGDEVSKSLLGQGQDPMDAVGAVFASGGIGAITGALFSKASKALTAAGEMKLGNSIKSMLSGIDAAAKGSNADEVVAAKAAEGAEDFVPKAFKSGMEFYNRSVKGAAEKAGSSVAGSAGYVVGGFPGAYLAEKHLAGPIAKFLYGPTEKMGQSVAPAVVKALSENPDAPNMASKLYGAINYANAADSGLQKINKSVENLFKGTSQKATNAFFEENRRNKAAEKKELEEYLDAGGTAEDIQRSIDGHNQVPAFAEGGEVTAPDTVPGFIESQEPIASTFPEQNIGMVVARNRISSYLQSLKPNANVPKLAFDPEPDMRHEDRSYNKALDIAVDPMSILDHIKAGTIEPDDIRHFNSMHPELSSLVKAKLTDGIVQAQVGGKMPTMQVRQGLSLFLGTPLSSEFTPQNMQAAQSVFQMQHEQNQQAQPNQIKKSTSSLSKIENRYLTSPQAEQIEVGTPQD